MVLGGNRNMDDSMPQIVPSAGFTPPCDYSNFADNFDLSLLPGADNFIPVSPSATFYAVPSPSPVVCGTNPKISTTFYPSSPQSTNGDIDLGPDFQKLLGPPEPNDQYLKVPSAYHSPLLSPYSPQSTRSPSDSSLYPHSPNSCYSQSSSEGFQIKKEFYPTYNIKEENFSSCAGGLTTSEVLDLLGTAIIKQETAIDFENILHSLQDVRGLYEVQEKPKDHQLLREVLRDTSFQKKYNIKPFDFDLVEAHIKMEVNDDAIIDECSDSLTSDKIDPVLNLAIEQMKKDITNTCTALSISPDPSQWTSSNVWSWMQWTSNQYGLSALSADQWDFSGANLVNLTEDEFARRAPQSGSILFAQLEIWKAAFSEEECGSSQWIPESTSSNASSGDLTDDEEEDPVQEVDTAKPTTSRATGSSHIHLWQFLKELLASPQIHGSCIRWIDRTKGIFKIEDSVKVARLWGKRKNRPAMNYDKLSRSIRQYYKKGIMKKTERSQRLVYQFCHPYNL